MKDEIIRAVEEPRRLEALYRANPAEFTRTFPAALAERPESTILQVWRERLYFQSPTAEAEASSSGRWRLRDIGWVLVISLAAGTLAKLPHFFSSLNEEQFYLRNLGGILAGALICYFCVQKWQQMKQSGTLLLALLGGALLYLNLLPDQPKSQSLLLACLHLCFFFWSLVGVAFLAGAWRNLGGRMEYIRYNGELLIYCTIIAIGGVVLTGLTLALFGLIDLKIENWYMRNVVIYGAMGAPLVATLLVEKIVGNRFRIAPVLAKVFTPLFFLTVIVYLLAMILKHKSPFTDRDFLIAFNGLLVMVLGLCVFSISEREAGNSSRVLDLMNTGLVAATLIIDIIALIAILFRLTSYGFTPNRVAVLGANILIFGHLAGIVYHYIRVITQSTPFRSLENWVAGYIPIYAIWCLLVAVVFPPLFSYR